MSKKPESLPLTTPDGEVLAYACGLCRRVHAGESTLGPPDKRTRRDLANAHKASADGCCQCRACKKVGRGMRSECDACEVKRRAEWQAGEPERAAALAAEEKVREEALAKALAKALDRDAAILLGQRMSDLSEDCWCATWLLRCEFELWSFVESGPGDWGMGQVEADDIAELKRLSEKAGGWVVWRETIGEMFVPMAEWLVSYRANERAA